MSYIYDYPRPALTVDALVFTYIEDKLYLLLIQRANFPFAGYWAFPGGFVNIDETAEQAVCRELKEETNFENIELHQLFTVSTVDRDPRGRTVSIIFHGFLNNNANLPIAGDDAKNAAWFDVYNLPELAFDHKKIIDKAIPKIGIKL